MRVPGCTQVRWLSCAAQLKWPMTYHTRRYAKTDHLLHVQQYLLYGWLKRMRTFHVSTGSRLKRDKRRDPACTKQLLNLKVTRSGFRMEHRHAAETNKPCGGILNLAPYNLQLCFCVLYSCISSFTLLNSCCNSNLHFLSVPDSQKDSSLQTVR